MKSGKSERIKKKVIEAIKQGSTIKCACASAGFSSDTLYKWMEKDSKFKLKIEQAGLKQVDIVVGSLIKKANGYEYTEIVEEEIILQGKRAKGVTVFLPAKKIKRTTKHYAPDTGAIVFYLCNRDKDNWKNTQNIIHASDPDNPIPIMCNGFVLNQYPKQKEKGKNEE